MKRIDYRDTLVGYKERVARLALFDVFAAIDRKVKKDADGKEVDYFGLLLSSLLFFFECMLIRKKESGIEELASHLKFVCGNHYNLSDADFIGLASQIVAILRPADGTRNKRAFYNFETRKYDLVEYSILKVSHWDKASNRQYYTLDDDGLELVFASKEFFSEFRISISQLVLRKQLEKGEFVGALRQIDEMKLSVHSIYQNMISIKHEIQQNIVSDETYERYKNVIEDINYRLQREHEEFNELIVFIKKTRHVLENLMTYEDKDRKANADIIKIYTELIDVHAMHSQLLSDSIELKTKALESARESMYYVGVNSFNFRNDIVAKIASTPLPLEVNELLVKPFLGLQKCSVFSTSAFFARQRLAKGEKQDKRQEFLKAIEEEQEQDLMIRQDKYELIFSRVLEVMDLSTSYSLKIIYETMDKTDIDMKDFCDFFIILHQFSPIDFDELAKNPNHVFYKLLNNENKKYLHVTEFKERILINNRYEINNMLISFE